MSITRRTIILRVVNSAFAGIAASAQATAGLFHRGRHCRPSRPLSCAPNPQRVIPTSTFLCAQEYGIGGTSIPQLSQFPLGASAQITLFPQDGTSFDGTNSATMAEANTAVTWGPASCSAQNDGSLVVTSTPSLTATGQPLPIPSNGLTITVQSSRPGICRATASFPPNWVSYS